MDYMTLKEAAEKWGVTPRRVNYYCAGGRIPGAVKMAGVWLIPKNAEKPTDRRRKEFQHVVYVHVMFNNDLKRIVVRGCDENDKDALRWCVAKPDKRKSRKMSCKPFATLVYQEMGWDSECRYKMLGYRITFEGETLYVFDLLVPEIFHEGQRRKKNAADSQDNTAATKPVDSRKGFYPDDIVGTFGVPVEEHRKESEVQQMDGYVSMGILTGKIVPEAGKD